MERALIGIADPHDRRPPKFGAASPQAVKKLLSLSEQTKTRPHQPRHFNNLMTHTGTGNTTNTFGICANTTASIGLGTFYKIISTVQASSSLFQVRYDNLVVGSKEALRSCCSYRIICVA